MNPACSEYDRERKAQTLGVKLAFAAASADPDFDPALAGLGVPTYRWPADRARAVLRQPGAAARSPGGAIRNPDHARMARKRRGRWADQLWAASWLGPIYPGRPLYRADPGMGRSSADFACRIADPVRAGDQPEDRRGTGPEDPAVDPRPRRRGDRGEGRPSARLLVEFLDFDASSRERPESARTAPLDLASAEDRLPTRSSRSGAGGE